MSSDRTYDIVIYGATGFTGELVAEYLNGVAGEAGVRWAISGRNAEKLAAVRQRQGLGDEVGTIVADAGDAAAMGAMASSTRLVIATAGPYLRTGEAAVKACAENGTDYVDLCGEADFMRAMIDTYSETAAASGARIVFACGFDSLPSDLGVYLAQKTAIDRAGEPIGYVKGRVLDFAGGASGGTIASIGSTIQHAMSDPEIAKLLGSPYALTPGFEGPRQPDGDSPRYDEEYDSWATAFVMASINTKSVHRSNLLLGHMYGDEFLYDEMIATGPGDEGKGAAEALAASGGIDMSGDLPAPGEGPSLEEREAGHFTIRYQGATPSGTEVSVTVKGFKDPGYGCTSQMITQSALTLLAADDLAAGIWSPAAAMGDALIEAMTTAGVLSFDIA